jgi:hypothetical protein
MDPDPGETALWAEEDVNGDAEQNRDDSDLPGSPG